MNKAEKIGKLARAIKEYRGTYDPINMRWTRQPKGRAIYRVVLWLEKLGLDTDASIPLINNFKSYEEMGSWLKSIS